MDWRFPESKWATPSKVTEIQTDEIVVANEPDIMVVEKRDKKAVEVDVAIPSDTNIRMKRHEKLKKY